MRHLLAIMVLFGLVLTGCGGGGSSDPQPGSPQPSALLSGTAAAGAPIIGQVTVKDSSSPVQSRSALIEANGHYTVDVSGMTAPFVLRAEGTVGGRTYKLHSYAEAADLGGTVNITPFTDLIVANAAGQLAETLFDNGDFSALSDTEIAAQQTALKNKLQNVLTSLGVDTAVDLLHTAFSADHTALDAALDMVRVTVDPTTIEATITNVIDNTSIVDDLQSTTDNTTTLEVVSDLGTAQSSQQAIYSLFNGFSALFANGLPSSSQLAPFLAADFLQDDNGAAQFITELTTDPNLVGLTFTDIVINDLDDAAGTASVTFNVAIGAKVDHETDTWLLAKNGTAWEMRGNQEIVDRWTDFICDDNTQADGSSFQGCGINLGADDMDFTNNGTGNQPIASARVTLLRNGVTVPGATVYLGVPTYGAAGQLRIFDADYSDDYMAFGTGPLQLDPSLIQVGDLLQFELFTTDLDTTGPAVTGTPVATYTTPVTALPIADGAAASYPSATQATLDAFHALTTAGGALTVAWETLPAGQTINELALRMDDGTGNSVEVWNDYPTGTSSTLTIDTSGLDPQAASYNTELRIYSRDAQGRAFLRTYHSVTGTGGGSSSPAAPTEFTTQLVDSISKVYIQYTPDPGDTPAPPAGTTTVQDTFSVTGSGGSYQLSLTTNYFDANGSYISSEAMGPFPLVLNQDGTLSVTYTDPADSSTWVTTWTLQSVNGDILGVTGEENTVPPSAANYSTWTESPWNLNVPPTSWFATP